MKLTHITMHYFPVYGGQETYIHSLNQFLTTEGIDVSIIQPSRPRNLDKPNYVHYLPRLHFVGRFGRLFVGIDWLWFNLMLNFGKSFLRKQDVLISHYPIHYPSIKWHKNVIVVSHGVDWPDPPRILLDKCKKKAALEARDNRVKIIANDTCFIRALGIEVEAGTRFFEEISKNIWFVPNCVDISKFLCRTQQRKDVILVPRNIRKSRGIHLAIEAFNLFHNKNKSFLLKIAGGPLSGEYYHYCLGLIKRYSLENAIHFTGHLPEDKLIQLYNEVKITLIPTIDFEGTSISALESMACNAPVVSTRTGGLQDLPTWKVGTSPEEISDGLDYVLSSWAKESERQHKLTAKIFNMSNWKDAWLRIIHC